MYKFKYITIKVLLSVTLLFVNFLNMQAATENKQYDSWILHPQDHDIFYGKADRLYLGGMWKFKESVNFLAKNNWKIYLAAKNTNNPQNDIGLQQKYYSTNYNDASWNEIPVPWAWNIKFPCEYKNKTKIVFRPFSGVGYYRREFTVAAEKMAKNAVLHFSSVQSECKIWVNGHLVGEHKNSTSEFGPTWRATQALWLDSFKVDITKFIHPGKNLLVLRVYDDGLPIMYEREPDHGGILGPVWLDFNNNVYASELLVAPKPESSQVELMVKFENCTPKSQLLKLTAEIIPFKSVSYTPPQKGSETKVFLKPTVITKGTSWHRFNIKIDKAVLWDIDNPFLYHLRLMSKDKLIGQTRFGLRKFAVKDKRFLLNSHPISLLGVNPEATWDTSQRIMAFNKADYLRKNLKLFKEVNISFLRNHSGPSTKIFYDICDELGIILEDDFSPSKKYMTATAKNLRIEYIANVKINSYFDASGKFTPEFSERIKKWVRFLHNHPSVCLFTGGNELGSHHGAEEQLVAQYINNFYDVTKKQDIQKRPITSSSGLCIYNWKTPVKSDFFDHHRYADWDTGWMDCVVGNKRYTENWKTIYGKEIDKPIINGEFGSYYLTKGAIKKYQFVHADNSFDKVKFIRWINKAQQDRRNIGYWGWLTQRFFSNSSVRTLLTMDAYKKEAAETYEKLLRVFRRDMPFYEGFAVHSIKPLNWGYSAHEALYTEAVVDKLYKKCNSDLNFKSLKKSFAPIYAALDMYDRNQFAGDTLKTKLFLVNNKFKTKIKELNIKILFENSKKGLLSSQNFVYKNIKEHARIWRDLSIPIDKDLRSGDYIIRIQIKKQNELLNEYIYPLFIMGDREVERTIISNKKVALYTSLFQISNKLKSINSGEKILQEIKIKYTKIKKFNDLNKFDLLIIGVNSFDSNLINNSGQILLWLENGGRILVLEQNYVGPVPFLSQMRLRASGNMFFAELLDKKHPLSDGLQGKYFELWNGKRKMVNGAMAASEKKLYDTYLTPVPESAVITGGERKGKYYGNQIFGMLTGEVKVGKGIVCFSQLQACKRYDTDAVARRYLNNLLTYVLKDKWSSKRARSVKGKKIEFIDARRCFFVNLKHHANKTFFDDVKADKRGGWTDEGPNDLRGIKRGKVIFMGIPFSILDDSDNANSCMVLRGTHRDYFPVKIEKIPVNQKAKRLFFLHTAAWSIKVKGKIGEYIVHYEDGTSTGIDLLCRENIDEWWGPADLPQAILAFQYQNTFGANVGLFAYAWNNKFPDKKITTIAFVSAETKAIPICVAITGEK